MSAMPLDDCPPPYSRLETRTTQASSLAKLYLLKLAFTATIITATVILISCVIFGALTLGISNTKKYSISATVLTVLGVVMLIATVPCCIYFHKNHRTSRNSRGSSCRSSFNEVDRPAIVSALFPEDFRLACDACLAGTCTSMHGLPPPYDAPPSYSPIGELGVV